MHRVDRLIGANIISDAFGTAVFLAGIGFFAVRSIGASPWHILNSLAVGTLAGVALSYLAASLVDTFGPKRVLLSMQALQAVVYLGMLLTRHATFILLLCAVGAALSRVTSPVRGTLPPVYLDKDRLLEFKSAVKVYTVIAMIAGSAVAAGVGLQTSHAGLLLIPGLNCLSFVVVLVLTGLLPDRRPATGRKGLSLYKPSPEVLRSCLFFAFLIGVGSVPESAVAVLAVQKEEMPSVVVAVAPVVSFAVAICGQRLLKGRSDLVRIHFRSLLIVALALAVVSLATIEVITFVVDAAVAIVVLVVVASVLAESALLAAIYCMWDVQYSIGSNADRGGIIGAFSVANAIGVAMAPAVASLLFFSGLGVSLVTNGVIMIAFLITWMGRVRFVQRLSTANNTSTT